MKITCFLKENEYVLQDKYIPMVCKTLMQLTLFNLQEAYNYVHSKLKRVSLH